MMSDIVERLEDMQERLVLSSDDDIIIFEAVSEIKKLRAENEDLQGELKFERHNTSELFRVVIEPRGKEIEKLRAALRESDQNFMRVDKERMKLRAKLMAATGELCDRAAAAALKEREMSEFSESIRAKYVTELFSKDCKPSDAMEFALKDTEAEIHRLRAENEKLRAAMHEIYEVYAGGEGFIPQTSVEACLHERVNKIADIAAKHLLCAASKETE